MAELLIYGVIGSPEDKLDARTVASQIRAASGPLTLRINSPGGYVMEGLAIVAAIREYRGKVTAIVDGLAASMGSVIAAACDECLMAEASMIMIHNPWEVAMGDAPELRAAADKLDRLGEQMIGIYAKRTGLTTEALRSMLDAETWLSADQAIEMGFADGFVPNLKVAAMADVSAFGFLHTPDKLKEGHMPEDTTQAVALERTRISTIMALSAKFNVPQNLANGWVERGLPLEQARAAMLDYLAERDDSLNIGHTAPRHGDQTLDNPTTRAKAMSDAIAARLQNKGATGPAAEYRGMSIANMARDHLARLGVQGAYQMQDERAIDTAFKTNPYTSTAAGYHTTSDFPQIMQTGVQTSLLEQYRTQVSPLKQLTSARDVPDFKAQTLTRVAAFGSLDQVNEHGEFKSKSMATSAETFKVSTFGNVIGFTRQMLINDSLGALADFTRYAARASANTEADVLAATINSNVPMADGNPWFHASHGNLATTGAAPSIASLDAGRLAMRKQKDLDGTLIDAAPRFLLVPASLETAADTLIAATIAPGTTTDPNPFAGKLTPIADPRLSNATAWFLFADPEFAPAFLSIYLAGQREPFVDTENGWRIDGTEIKVRHDFGAGVVDAKMAWKNPGA